MLAEIIWSSAKTMQIKSEANNYLYQIQNNKLTIKFEVTFKPLYTVVGDFLRPFLIESKDRKIEVYVR